MVSNQSCRETAIPSHPKVDPDHHHFYNPPFLPRGGVVSRSDEAMIAPIAPWFPWLTLRM